MINTIKYAKCSEDQVDQLLWISKKTFVEAFEKDNNPKDFKKYIETAFSEDALKHELALKDTEFYFVYSKETLAAYFKLNVGSAQTDIKMDDSIELERIYVLSAFQNIGLGAELLTEVKHIAVVKDKTMLWLGVWEKNKRAIQFYQRQGFKKFGTHPYFIGLDEQTDWLMRLDLSTL